MYQKRVRDVSELKERLVEVWSEFGQAIVDEAIDEWRKRLKACIHIKGTSFRTYVVKLDDICHGNLIVIVAFATVCEISCA